MLSFAKTINTTKQTKIKKWRFMKKDPLNCKMIKKWGCINAGENKTAKDLCITEGMGITFK